MRGDVAGEVCASWEGVREKGAFVFDVDETLLLPDQSLGEVPRLQELLLDFLTQGLQIGFISGGPGSVVKNRILNPLQKAGKPWRDKGGSLLFYVNGGCSKYTVGSRGDFREDASFSEGKRIPGETVEKVKALLEEYLKKRLWLNEAEYLKLLKVWGQKRDEQWGRLEIVFDDAWVKEESWRMACLDDKEMAAVKEGEKRVWTSFPFINTRCTQWDREGRIQSVASFTPCGFYPCDGPGHDVRDSIIRRLRKDLGGKADELKMLKAGRSSIDITRGNVDKAAALKDLIVSLERDPACVYYWGDEFFDGGNDEPLARDRQLKEWGVHLLAFNRVRPPSAEHVLWAGTGTADVSRVLERIRASVS